MVGGLKEMWVGAFREDSKRESNGRNWLYVHPENQEGRNTITSFSSLIQLILRTLSLNTLHRPQSITLLCLSVRVFALVVFVWGGCWGVVSLFGSCVW